MSSAPQRALPSLDRLLQALGPSPLPRPVIVRRVREQVAAWRASGAVPSFDTMVASLRADLARLARGRLQPVINGTGILAHTNLGRSPLSASATRALLDAAHGYSNLEFDLESGQRGQRGAYLESCLAQLCEAEAATVVNNCAAALVLILHHFARETRREVVISRGELIQIGGGFRVPEILESAGAVLREVGTTNRTHVEDYHRAIGPRTALILRVHPSNFVMEGFVESPSTTALAGVARDHGIPLVEDLGSGALIDLAKVEETLPREPQAQEALRAGAALVCFSGDKLLGGPQAGIIAGQSVHVGALKRDPLFRALRGDKLVFAALQATVESYLHAAARRDVGFPADLPVLDMMRADLRELRRRAGRIAEALLGLPVEVDPGDGEARIGGGVCPRARLVSPTLRLKPREGTIDDLAARLRLGQPPVIAVVAEDRCQLHLRTILPDQDAALIAALRAAFAGPSTEPGGSTGESETGEAVAGSKSAPGSVPLPPP